MKEEGKFAYLQGFCPEGEMEKAISTAGSFGAGYVVEDPDETPTLITTPKWLRVIAPVFSFMNTLPGYKEYDISFYFLIFFSLFFAMLVGDAGYGCLFLITTFIARRILKRLPWEPFFLMYVLSGATIVWGAITGTWFGVEKIAEMPFFHSMIIEKINSFSSTNQNFMIYICFVIGVAHLTVAHLIRIARMINSVRAIAQAGWIMVLWGMFFLAGKFVIDRPFPEFAGWLLMTGPVLVLLFSAPEKGVLKGMLSTLAELPLNIISSFSDIVSYLRLFAVGYASVVVASSFNDMAAAGAHGLLGSLAAAGILFFGHALNITLAFMAVIVHGIRLNMLEFSGHLGMQWSGKKYEPYAG